MRLAKLELRTILSNKLEREVLGLLASCESNGIEQDELQRTLDIPRYELEQILAGTFGRTVARHANVAGDEILAIAHEALLQQATEMLGADAISGYRQKLRRDVRGRAAIKAEGAGRVGTLLELYRKAAADGDFHKARSLLRQAEAAAVSVSDTTRRSAALAEVASYLTGPETIGREDPSRTRGRPLTEEEKRTFTETVLGWVARATQSSKTDTDQGHSSRRITRGSKRPKPRNIAAEVSMRLVAPDATSVPVKATLLYQPADPYAITVSFHAESATGEAVTWSFARELMVTGLNEPAGPGDVRVWPWATPRGDFVALALSSPDGNALFEVPRSVLVRFLRRTYVAVPRGRESEHQRIALDSLVTDLGEPDNGLTEDAGFDEDPPDEPEAQPVTPSEAARLSQMSSEVLVVDGRPRYHIAGCTHLRVHQQEPLMVREATELGFTPCSVCKPNIALLVDDQSA